VAHDSSTLRLKLPFLPQVYNVRYAVDSAKNSAGKRQAKYNTVRQELPDALLFKHFAGTAAVSVQPLLEDGATCKWGAIDVDEYGIEGLVDTVRERLNKLGATCYVEESKSGAAHAYFILEQPVPARAFRRALKKLATWIGFPDAEIRPAQDTINVHEGDVGRLMVLPCFGVEYFEAMQRLEEATTTVEALNALTDEGDFADLPPCLFPLQVKGSRESWSNRNLFLYQLGVAYRYKYTADWQDRLRKYNTDVISPSLDPAEVEATIAQLEKNNKCHYVCASSPFDAVCNKPACMLRKYGVAARESISGLISPESICVLDTDPPTWFVSLIHPITQESHRVKLTTAQLQNVAQFKKRCIEVLKVMPTLPAQKEWEAVVSKLMENVVIEPVPFELTPAAFTYELLFKYLLSAPKADAADVDNILDGRVLTDVVADSEDVKVTFRIPDFIQYATQYRLTGLPINELVQNLHELVRIGKVVRGSVKLAELQIDVYTTVIESRYFRIKTEIDLDVAE